MAEDVRRVVVLGRAGAGKSTVALRLGRALDVPVVHLDTLFWTRNWQPVDPELFASLHAAALQLPAGIIEGGYTTAAGFDDRLRWADLIVVVEAPLVFCVWRVVRRSLIDRHRERPDRPAGAGEQFSIHFLWWLVTWSHRHPNVPAEMRQRAPDKRVVVIRDGTQLEALLEATTHAGTAR